MPITDPKDYPEMPIRGLEDLKIEKPIGKPPIRIYLKPFSQKVVEQYLWLEVAFIFMVLATGIFEIITDLSYIWYLSLLLITVFLGSKSLMKEWQKRKPIITGEPVKLELDVAESKGLNPRHRDKAPKHQPSKS